MFVGFLWLAAITRLIFRSTDGDCDAHHIPNDWLVKLVGIHTLYAMQMTQRV